MANSLSLLLGAYIHSKCDRRDRMNATRQDAWTQDEDVLLAETVLRHIREGNTQLEAFEEVAKRLSRTSAACGFRWNATVRKQYQKGIQLAKLERKSDSKKNVTTTLYTRPPGESLIPTDNLSIDDAISLLEKMKDTYPMHKKDRADEDEMKKIQEENKYLKQQVKRYQQAWAEMGKLWGWVQNANEKG